MTAQRNAHDEQRDKLIDDANQLFVTAFMAHIDEPMDADELERWRFEYFTPLVTSEARYMAMAQVVDLVQSQVKKPWWKRRR